MGLQLSTDWTYHGLRIIMFENELLRVLVMPESGGKIWQITYKPTGTDLLWNNPRIAPARHSIHARYDDVWSGGWDELFPVDEEATILGERYPDHGELWTGQWSAEPFANVEEAGVVLRFQTPISSFAVEKRIFLQRESTCVRTEYRFTNLGSEPFPFLWKLHPAFQVSDKHRIDFPAMQVVREPAFAGTLEEAALNFTWPYAQTPTKVVDLRRVPHAREKQVYFFYGIDMEAGWCALTNTETGLSCGLRFDSKVFPSCWLFASYGGWRSYNVAVLEPCTGYPLNFDSLVAAGRERTLLPGETLTTAVLFSVEQGHQAIAEIDEDGAMLEEFADRPSAVATLP